MIGSGAKREVDYISVSDYSMGDYFFEECGYDKAEVIKILTE